MTTLLFVVPCHGRHNLTTICLTQLRRTCDQLDQHGIHASAVIVGDDDNLRTARHLGFGTVERDNRFLSRKFNDGIQLATDPTRNPRPADYVVPCGSDDWVDPAIFDRLPGPGTILGFQQAAFVNETGTEIVSRVIDYQAGVGIRVYPRELMALLDYRPADEDRPRGCDTSILVNVMRAYQTRYRREVTVTYGDVHPWQIVDWKSPGEQLNRYDDIVARFRRGERPADPFDTLAGIYPADALERMREHYGARVRVAA